MNVQYENYPDYRIREKVWESQIPVKIDLAFNDISSLEIPKTCYV